MSAASDSHVPDRCDSIRPLLSVFADGMATATESALVEEHIADCASCSSRLAELRLLHRAVRAALPDMQPPGDLFARVASATWQRPSLRDRIFGYLRPAPVRVALGSVLAFGIAAVVIAPRIGGGGSVQAPTVAKNKGGEKSSEVATNATSLHEVDHGTGTEEGISSPSQKPVPAPAISKPSPAGITTGTRIAEIYTAPVKPVHIAPAAPKEGLPLKPPSISQQAKANVATKIEQIEQIETTSPNTQTARIVMPRPALSGRGLPISREAFRPPHNALVLPTPAPVKIETPTASAMVAETRPNSVPEIKHVPAGPLETTALTATPEQNNVYVPKGFSGKLLKGSGTDLQAQNTTIPTCADRYHVALSGSPQVVVCQTPMGGAQ